MKIKAAIAMTIFLIACIGLSGCSLFNTGNAGQPNATQSPDTTNQTTAGTIANADNVALENLLPSRAGFNWRYNGFAEYGHSMSLLSIAKRADETRYSLAGTVDDMSGGDSGLPAGSFDLTLSYIVKNGVLIQEKTETMMMDSESDRIELLRTPLTLNAKWTQEITTKNNAKLTLDCEITEIKDENGIKMYTVMYKDRNSDYYEKRQIKEKTGVVSLEKLWIDQDKNQHQIGYSLYAEVTGYAAKMELDSYIPPLDKLLRFFGLAEYAHEGKMTLVTPGDDKSVYRFDGVFTDGSGLGGTFKVEYTFDYVNGTVTEKVTENSRTGKTFINSKLPEHIVLKLPIHTGTAWQQEITVDGVKHMMDAKIVSVAYRGRTEYSPELTDHDRQYPVVVVRYLVRDVSGYYNDTYIEQRTFQVGMGMVGFENLMSGDIGVSGKDLEDKYKVEEALLMHMFGYSLDRTSLQ